MFIFSQQDVKAQGIDRYQVIVNSDSIGTQRGELQNVDAVGLTLKTGQGKLVRINAGNMIRVRVYKKYLSFGQAVLVGTVSGAALGSTAFLSDLQGDVQVAIMLISTGAGVIAGTSYGLASRLFLRELRLVVNNDVELFKREYQQLRPFVVPSPGK